MKSVCSSRSFLSALLVLLSAVTALAGNLTVNITPAAAVSAGAQWQVDGGAWKASGTTVKNLSNAAHTITYKTISGWVAPASTSVTLTNNVTTTVSGAYYQPSSLAVTLTPSGGQWRVDGGVWRASGTTATGLTPGDHSISYNALANYTAPATETVTLVGAQTTNLSRNYTAVSALTVSLTPSSASWQLDGGSWQASGATLSNLVPGNHTIAYSNVPGMLPLASETISLPAAQPISISRSYTAESGVIVNLTPATAQWRVDGGSWQGSGIRVGQLIAGNHTIDYNAVSGYTAPTSESVALVSGQTATINRSYTAFSAITVALTPSSGSWRVDAGAWQSSGATVTNLTPGNHSISYSTVSGMLPLAGENISLPGAETTSIARSYTAESGVIVNLTPATAQWRVDGGAWQLSGTRVGQLAAGSHTIDYNAVSGYATPASETAALVSGQTNTINRSYNAVSSLTVTLTPSSATWRLDGGSWQGSGATLADLTPGTHTISYATVTGMLPLAGESISLPATEVTTISRSYTEESAVVVNLTPATAQWRVDGGAWQPSGTRVGQLVAGNHTIDYSGVSGYTAPSSENATTVAGDTNTISRSYTAVSSLTVTLTPSSGSWRVDGGAWKASGTTVANLTPGAHTIAYSTVSGMLPLPGESISLPGAETTIIARSYTAESGLIVNLNPTNAWWRVDGGPWQTTGNRVGQLAAGDHTISYLQVTNFTTPAPETITLVSGQTSTITRSYDPLSSLTMILTPSNASWQLDGTGPWWSSGTMRNLTPGTHSISYAALPGMLSPPAETISLPGGQTTTITRNYTPESALVVNLTPATARWRVDSGAWQPSGIRVGQLVAGDHTIAYEAVNGYVAPAEETIALVTGQTTTISRTYTGVSGLTLTLTPSTGSWQVDGGAWQPSGATVAGLSPGSHTITYSSVTGMLPLPAETLNLPATETTSISRSYTAEAGLVVNLTPATAQWRVDAAVWRNSGDRADQLAGGNHAVEYKAVTGYITPPSENVALVSGQTLTLTRSYTALASLTVNLSDPNGWWNLDNTGWRNSGQTLTNLTLGTHTLTYADTASAIAPPSETLTLAAGDAITILRNYTPAGQVYVSLNPGTAQWRVDGGTWRASATYSGLIVPGTHTLEYSAAPGKVTPPAESINIVAGQILTVSRTYAVESFLTITLTQNVGQWRVDGGAWRNSGVRVGQLAAGNHSVEYIAVNGYIAPPAETVALTTGGEQTLTRSYLRPASLTVTVNPGEGQWRLVGGAWQSTGATLTGLRPGSYTIQFSSVPGYFDLNDEAVTLAENENKAVTYTYNPQASLTVTLSPGNAMWRLNGGAWQASGTTIGALWASYYTIDYSPVEGWITPPSESFFLNLGEQKTMSRTYDAPRSLSVTLTPAIGQWRVDGGAWQASGNVVSAIASGAHLVEYGDAAGYIAPPAETVSLGNTGAINLTRTYRDASTGYLTVNVVPKHFAEIGVAKWRVDGGVWNPSGETVAVSPGSHTLEFQPVDGLDVPAATTVTATIGTVENLEATYYMPHRFRFFLHGDLVNGLPTAELQARLSQYVAHLQTIWDRESFHRFLFNPETDISVVWTQPFSTPTVPLPEYGFELWAYADAAGAGNGSSGGSASFDMTGAAGVGDMHWAQIYDPSTLAAGSTELVDYWKQIDTLTRELGHVFGAGVGNYGTALQLPDLTGVAPLNSVDYFTAADPFWNTHSDFWRDPALHSAWGNYRLDNPTALPALLDAVHFSATSRAIINGCYRNAVWPNPFGTLPDISHVRVIVVDANTRQPISGALVRMWHRPTPDGLPGAEEWVQPIGIQGTFQFSWMGNNQWSPFNGYDNAKVFKASASGYQSKAQWEWIYDAQHVKIIDGADIWEITIPLNPAP